MRTIAQAVSQGSFVMSNHWTLDTAVPVCLSAATGEQVELCVAAIDGDGRFHPDE